MTDQRPAMASCFGGGGAFGIGFNMGVAAGLLDEGIDVRLGPMIGTSAGGYSVAALAAGIGFDRVAQKWEAFTATSGKVWVRTADLTEQIYGELTANGVATVSLTLWLWRRTLLRGEDHRLSDIVAATASPIPLARPHKIGQRRYLDGGLRRLASADLAPNADLLVLVTPFSSPRQGWTGKAGARQATKEIKRWETTNGGRVVHIGPPDDVVALKAKGMKALADMRVAAEVFAMARDAGRKSAAVLRQDAPDVVDRLSNPRGTETSS